MDITLKVKSSKGNSEIIESYLTNGLKEEEKKILFAINATQLIINNLESKYKKDSSTFLSEFKKGILDETPDFFDWWAELKVIQELKDALETLKAIELCPE